MSGEGNARMLDVHVRRADGTAVVAAEGEIDVASVSHLQTALEQAQSGSDPVVVDLSGVGFMGSAGLSALLVAAETAKPHRLRVVAASAVRRPIEVTGLDKVLAVFDTLESALAAGELSATS
jgi:anti-anti-sigma factor